MANNVVGPWEVDSTLTKWFGFGATVLQNAGDLAQLGPEPFAAAAGQHGFVNGFVSARTAEGQKILLNAVLRFPDPGAAAAAATEFGDIAAKTGEGVQRAQMPGHPDTKAASYTSDRGLHRQAVECGARIHGSRPVRVHATRAGHRRHRTQRSVWSPRPWTCRALSSTSSAPPTCPSSATSRSIRPDCWRERCQFRTKRRRPSRTPPTNNAARCTSRTIRRARRRCSPRPGPIWWRWRKRTSTRPRTPRARREDRRRVLRRVAADVAAGQAGQQPAGQPLPAIGGQELLLSGCGRPLRNRNHLGEAVGCPAAGGRPVRDAGERLSFRRARPAAPAR